MRYATILIPIALLFLGGCSSTTTPPIKEYTIYPSSGKSSLSQPMSSKTLRVMSPKAPPSLSGRELLYLRENGEIGNYLYTRWSDVPSSLIERSLIHTLQEKKLFATLLNSTSSAQADILLESDLSAFYHRLEGEQESYGVIDITYRLIDAKTKLPIASKRFYITKLSPTQNGQGGVKALDDATRELTHQCTQWILQEIKP